MSESLINNFTTTLAAQLLAAGTSATLQSGDGAKLRTLGGAGNTFRAVLAAVGSNPTGEILLVTIPASGDVCTVARTQEGTSASGTMAIGATFAAVHTAGGQAQWQLDHGNAIDGVVNSSTTILGSISGSSPSRMLTLANNGFPIYAPLLAYDYYVDSVNGLDTNTGTTQAAPFKTLAKLKTNNLTSKCVGLARGPGNRFRESYDLSSGGLNYSNVVTEAYGQGSPPIIDGSLVIPNANFSLTSGAVYQTTVTPTILDNASFIRAWENDVQYKCVASVAACQATPGTYTTSYIAAGTIASAPPTGSPTSFTLYIHTLDGSSPISNGKTYEYTGINFQYKDNEDGTCVMRGIWCRRNMSNNGSVRVYGQFLDGRISEGGKHNAIIGQGSVLQNTDLYDAYFAGQGLSMLEFFDPSATGNGNAFVDNCRLFMNKNVTANDYAASGAIGSHEGGSTSYGTFAIKGSTISGFNGAGSIAMGMTGCQQVIITGCTIKDCSIGIQNYSATTVIGGSIETNTFCIDIHAAVPVSIRGTTMTTTSGAGFTQALNILGQSVPSMLVEDCVFLSNTGNSFAINGVATKDVRRRNVFQTTYAHGTIPVLTGQGANQVLVTDENIFPNGPTNCNVMDTVGNTYNITAYRANSGQESGAGAFPLISISASATLMPSHYAVIFTGASGTITLPTAVGLTGKVYEIKNVGATTLTIATTSSQTIFVTAAVTTTTLSLGGAIRVRSDGANWSAF